MNSTQKQYEAIIAKRERKPMAFGFDVDPTEINQSLFPFQQWLVRWGLKTGRAAIFSECGTGKSRMQLEWGKHVHAHSNGDILILCPLAVAQQTVREGVEIGVEVTHCRKPSDVRRGINITNYERLEGFDPSAFSGIILDECFASGTLIKCFHNGIETERKIEDIRPNDQIYNAAGVDTVADVHRREVEGAVRIKFGGKSIICSQRHPWFTQRGWIEARMVRKTDWLLETSEAVRMVRTGVYNQDSPGRQKSFLREILLSEMANEPAGAFGESSHEGDARKNRKESVSLAKNNGKRENTCRKISESKSYGRSGNAGEGEPHIERNEAQTFRAWRKREGYDSSAIAALGGITEWMGERVCRFVGKKDSRISDLLQGGFSESNAENSNRSGWSFASAFVETSTGQEEGFKIGFIGVESVEILESRHPELDKFRDAEGRIYFYDLGLTRHPSFTVNGCLVHNSSILKSFDGATKNMLCEMFSTTPYRLCCTATPAPNDFDELGQHSEFLGWLSAAQMRATWFVNDTQNTGAAWRLKGHAHKDFWKWIASWAACLGRPSDLGFSDDGYELPPLNMIQHTVAVDYTEDRGEDLFRVADLSATNLHREMRLTTPARVASAAALVNESREHWVVWCNTNYEADALKDAMPEAVEIRGSDSPEDKERKIEQFSIGKIRVLISKSSITGWGVNWQHCHNTIFVGLSYSFEALYQAVRRFWRFGQTKEVNAHIICAESEGAIVQSINRKIQQHDTMKTEMQTAAKELQTTTARKRVKKEGHNVATGDNWTYNHGDCVMGVSALPENSVHFTVTSPPFIDLFTYSDDIQDHGNCNSLEDFMESFKLLVAELYRVTMPGRLCAIHCLDLMSSKWKDGEIGLKNFSGEIVKEFMDIGWLFHSRVTIWKDPVLEMQRTKALGLLHKQLKKDSAMSRVGNAEYLCVFRKPGENPEPITHTNEDYPVELWQRDASPVWMDVRQTNVLNGHAAREAQDERHICLAEGSLVLTRECGYIKIEDVSVGMNVLTHNGRWMPVIEKRCNGFAETIRTCAQGVADLVTTPDHKLWTCIAKGKHAKSFAMKSGPQWAEASTVLGSYLNLPLPPQEPSLLTEKEWWIVGRWLGDGHNGGHKRSGKRNGVGQFLISCAHEEADELRKMLGENAGHSADRTATQIAIVNLRREVREVLNRCGHGAKNKHLPGEAVTLPKKEAEALLTGYLSADGHYVERHDRYMASSVSRSLLLGMAMIAQRARDVVASVYSGRPEREGEIQGRQVHMSQDWIFAFRNSEGFKKSGWIDELGAWKKVRKIELAGSVPVWDIQVLEDASFVAEGAVVHNCPLQLDVIERAIRLWTNKGDIVLSPYGGIASEGFQAIKMGRKFIGYELKESYWKEGQKYLEMAEAEAGCDLFQKA